MIKISENKIICSPTDVNCKAYIECGFLKKSYIINEFLRNPNFSGLNLKMTCQKLINHTGKFMSETLIFASTDPQYDNRLFIELPVYYTKIPSSERGENIGRTWENMLCT